MKGPAGYPQLVINQAVRQPRASSDAFGFRNTPVHPFNHQNFALIQAPGFNDHTTLQNILVNLDRYLASGQPQDQPLRLTGIIYVYPEEAPDDSALGPILQTLKAFVGSDYAERVTLYLSPGQESCHGPNAKAILGSSPVIRSFYDNTPDPKIITSSLNRQTINRILGSYAELGPCRTYVQNKTACGEWVNGDILAYLRRHVLGGRLSLTPNRLSPGSKEHAEPQTPDNETQAPAQPRLASQSGTTQEAAYKDRRIQSLTQEPEQTQAECAYLRSHMYSPDKAEESELIGMLDHINGLIEEVAWAIATYLIEQRGQGDALVGKVLPLWELPNVCGQIGESVFTSGSSTEMSPNLRNHFVDIIRAFLCNRLYDRIFKPFHPSLAENELENSFITEVYDRMTYREFQSIVGHWRKDAFDSISSTIGSRPKVKSTRQSIGESLDNLLKSYHDPAMVNMALTGQHEVMLDKIVSAAEDFNQLIKGGIVHLGDYQPILRSYEAEFQPAYMKPYNRFEAIPPNFNTTPATVRLGLIKRYAWGDGQKPDDTILRCAVAAHEGGLRGDITETLNVP